MMFQKDWPANARGKFDVSEGASGIITVKRHDEIVFHILPDCNIESALENLEAFFDLPTGATSPVRNQFLALDRDWVATTVSPLFWNFFLQHTKYRTIINAVWRGDVELNFTGDSRLEEILVALELHQGSTVPNSFVQRCYFALIRMRNRLVVKKDAELLLVCQTLDNFRLSEIADALMERFSIVRYVGFRKDTVFKHFFDPAVMFAEGPAANVSLLTSAALKDQGNLRDQAAMNYAVSSCNALIGRYVQFRKTLKSFRFSYLASLDDANWIYPLIYAAEDSGIQTVGIQHGLYCDRHPAYVMKGIRNHYWFDELLVWGDYWRDKILAGNSFPFPSHCHVASNKHSYDASPQERTAERPGILIPFEFLADTNAIGKFICGFIDAGFNIFLKTRSDFDVSEQLESYCLGKRGSDIILVHDITGEIMANVDVVAGSQSTLIFDLMKYDKVVWILDTDLNLLTDIPEMGWGRLFKVSDLQRAKRIFDEDVKNKPRVPVDYIFGDRPIAEVLESVLNGNAKCVS